MSNVERSAKAGEDENRMREELCEIAEECVLFSIIS